MVDRTNVFASDTQSIRHCKENDIPCNEFARKLMVKAVCNGEVEQVRLALEANCNPNVKYYGESMLYWVNLAHHGIVRREIERMLIEAGAK